jgi:hypothetical protein
LPPAPRRFGYYARLDRAQRAIYRRSDAITTIEVAAADRLSAGIDAIAAALAAGDRVEVQGAAQRLCDGLADALGVPPVVVAVRAVRPSGRGMELHGLYTQTPGRRPRIEVWMRTARHERTVAFRTFLRTLIHEVCHHLDYTLLGLEDSFHTTGFFRRESSLVRQLAPPPARRAAPAQLALPGVSGNTR